MGTSLKGNYLLPEGANSFLYEQFLIDRLENTFYHIKWPPLNVTIFITHVRNLRNGCYANVDHSPIINMEALQDQYDQKYKMFSINLTQKKEMHLCTVQAT